MGQAGRHRVLVIDDQTALAELLADAFREDGFEVDIAFDGESGLRRFHQDHYDLVVTDIIMPGVDGIETIQQIRRTSPGAKVVAISGGGKLDPDLLLDFASKLGADAALAKPFRPRELVSLGADLLRSTSRHWSVT